MSKFISSFSQMDSVLTPGFTDRDATPPDYFKISSKAEAKVEVPTAKIDDEEQIPDF